MKQGFTLLELSIVLVIIGLIIGGITVGADLIESAKISNITRDIGKYKTALMTFKLKYNALPGDMTNATAYWGQAGDGSDAQCVSEAGTGTQTCNGDGDGTFEYYNVDKTYEPHRAWEHLSNSAILSGNYTGKASGNSNFKPVAGVDAPEAAIDGTLWSLIYINVYWGGKDEDRNVMALGNPSNESGNWYGEALLPEQQFNIDTKLDDGKPYTGSITEMSGTGFTLECATAHSNNFSTPDAEYNLAYDTAPACTMLVDLD